MDEVIILRIERMPNDKNFTKFVAKPYSKDRMLGEDLNRISGLLDSIHYSHCLRALLGLFNPIQHSIFTDKSGCDASDEKRQRDYGGGHHTPNQDPCRRAMALKG